jgi:propionate catabolism operon transcriptional regulator
LFELAHRGTLFLDEISEIPPTLQGRLLRAIQEKEIMRLGHDRVIPVDVRIIAASNRNLLELVKAGDLPGGPILPDRHPYPGTP